MLHQVPFITVSLPWDVVILDVGRNHLIREEQPVSLSIAPLLFEARELGKEGFLSLFVCRLVPIEQFFVVSVEFIVLHGRNL